MRIHAKFLLSAPAVAVLAAVPALAQGARDDVFGLGQIVVVGSRIGVPAVGGAVVTRDQMWTFEKLSLDQASTWRPA